MRRWEEIKIRQHRLMAEVESQNTPAHLDHIMKSGFTMSDIKGLNRNFSEDPPEVDEHMLRPNPNPARPPRKGSLSRPSIAFDPIPMEITSKMQRSSSALDMARFQSEPLEDKPEKKRGRSPFRFFKKNRDQSKEKAKSKSKTPERMDRSRCKYIHTKNIYLYN